MTAASSRGTATASILIIEDDPAQMLALTDRLVREGYRVERAADGRSGVELAASGNHDLVILDVMLPGKNGFEVASEVRGRGLEAPILMLTARGEVTDKVVGLNSGADDYLTKPFEFIELLARISALLRRADRGSTGPPPSAVQLGEIHIDFRSAEVRRGDQVVQLSARELELLRYLVEHHGAVLSRDELLDAVWGYDSLPTTRTVDVHVARLRQKLESAPSDPQYILTVRGLGYKLVVPDPS